jgi:hypothetical protein
MSRVLDNFGVVPLLEPKDWEAGGDFDSFKIANAAGFDVVIQFGAVTGDAVLTAYCGATDAAKTTAIPFRYRLSSGDFKAASADLYAAEATDADGIITLTAATYDHRVLVIHFDAAEVPDGKPFVTLELSAAASVLLASAVLVATAVRNQPALTFLP